MQRILKFYQQKITTVHVFVISNFNESLTKDIVKFEQPAPGVWVGISNLMISIPGPSILSVTKFPFMKAMINTHLNANRNLSKAHIPFIQRQSMQLSTTKTDEIIEGSML